MKIMIPQPASYFSYQFRVFFLNPQYSYRKVVPIMGVFLIKVPESDYFICFELDISAKE